MPRTISHLRRSTARTAIAAALSLLAACASLQPGHEAKPATAQKPETPAPAILAPYLETLTKMAPGDPARQAAELQSVQAAVELAPTAANRLRYALALGAAGGPDSNPVEARRLIGELLAGPNDLKPQEVELAQAFQREYEARMELYADLARERQEFEQQQKASDATAERRVESLAAENARIKKQLAEAERKLEAVAEMERTLLEQAQKAQEAPSPPRP